MNMERLLVIGAHPDDAELMFGGIMSKYSRTGNELNIIIVSDGANWNRVGLDDKQTLIKLRRKEAEDAAKILGVKKVKFLNFFDGMVKRDELIPILIDEVRKLNPTIILTHSEHEGHPDHIEVSKAVQRICNLVNEPLPISNALWPSEVPPVTNFKGLFVSQNIFEKFSSETRYILLDEQDIENKVEAVLCYKSQFLEREASKTRDKLFTEAKFYGNIAFSEYAEVVVKNTIKTGEICNMLFEEKLDGR